MVDPAPNLRNLAAQAIYTRRRDEAIAAGLGYVGSIPPQFYEDADAVLAVLKRHPQAVLEHLGDTRKGWMHSDKQGWIVYDFDGEQTADDAVFVVSLDDAAKEATDV